MKYLQLLERLNSEKEEKFACFQEKLVPTKQKILGVRTPIMRKIAKEYKDDVDELFTFPDEYFEVTFIKLAAVSLLPYERFILYVEECVALMDNWAMCDCFKAKCIAKHKEAFLPILQGIYARGGAYAKRYLLVTLLFSYMEERYLPLIKEYLYRTPTDEYYLHMAVAWLTAEVIVKHYDYGIAILKEKRLSRKTHNKGIQKAIESYRLTTEQKEFLRSLKIKNT